MAEKIVFSLVNLRVVFPNKKDVEPRYDQISLKDIATKNSFYQVLSPNAEDQGVWIYQDAWFHLGDFDAGTTDRYSLKKKGNGVYAFVLQGDVEINGQVLSKRDGYGLWGLDQLELKATTDAKVLLMEVPMTL